MPTKHIDKLLWERIEQKTVDIVILQRKMVKDTDVLQCLIESALDNISDEELSELIKKNSKSKFWIGKSKMRNRVFVCFNSFDLLTDFIDVSEDIIFRDEESLRRYIESRTKNNYMILSENDVAHEIYVKKGIDNKLGTSYIVYPVYIS